MMSDSLDAYLRRHEDGFRAACEAILRSPAPVGTAYGLFWFQIDDYVWDRLPLALVWCNREHGCDAQYPSPLTALLSAPWSLPEGLGNAVIGERLFRWIHVRWTEAGGARASLPFYCHNYHTGAQFCLRRARPVADEEVSTDIEPAA